MKQDVWAEFFPLLSSNDEPQHGLYPEEIDSWCEYCVTESSGPPYDHTDHFHVAHAVMLWNI